MSTERERGFDWEDVPREECGIFAVIHRFGEIDPTIADQARAGILGLQHRGEDGAGIGFYDAGSKSLSIMKDEGLITSVFGPAGSYLSGVETSVAIAHARYGTGGESGASAAHPHNGKFHNFMLALNGHNYELEDPTGHKTDTERLVDRIDDRMKETGAHFRDSLLDTLRSLKGGYSLVASDGECLYAARDPWGFRPLFEMTDDTYHYFSSEDSALARPEYAREVPANSFVTVLPTGESFVEPIYEEDVYPTTCSMESAYFARPDTTLGGRNVQQVRYRIGQYLAQQEPDYIRDHIDIVIGVPDSGSDSATAYAEALGLPYRRAISKNAYVGRTFIQEKQEARIAAAKLKFRINRVEVAGRNVVVVDDSIVRGTNSRIIVQMLRDAGAAEVHLRAGFPEHRYPCIYGIDTGNPSELIANKMTHEEMQKYLDVDSLGYITPENLRRAISPRIGGLCMACVTGDYPTGFTYRGLSNDD